jgi:hypothetical protein
MLLQGQNAAARFCCGGNLDLGVYNNFMLFSEKFLFIFRKIYFFYCISVFTFMMTVEASAVKKERGDKIPPISFKFNMNTIQIYYY